MNDLNMLPERDRVLAARLAATLDQAAGRPDAALDAALTATRASLLSPPRQRTAAPWLWASGMALAAGLAMVFVLPGGHAPAPAPHAVVAPAVNHAAVAAPVEDPEMLDNLDMLQALSAGGTDTRS